MSILPDKVLTKMSAEDRKAIGKAGKTVTELNAAQEIKSEKELQRQCVALLRQHNIYVVVSRMDRPTRNGCGTPDLIFAVKGTPCAFECKLPKGKLTEDQIVALDRMSNNGWHVKVIRSVEEMLSALRELEKDL